MNANIVEQAAEFPCNISAMLVVRFNIPFILLSAELPNKTTLVSRKKSALPVTHKTMRRFLKRRTVN